MKVVLFCGGQGMRMREYSDAVPKPMVPIGYRPILWHLMKYYAHYGHKEFILCLGHRGDLIKDYFLNYNECITNDFVLSGGGSKVELLAQDIADWKITFADTGLHSNVGERLVKARKFLGDDEMFLANYADGLSDVPLDQMIERFRLQDKAACVLGVRPLGSHHLLTVAESGLVKEVRRTAEMTERVNGGFFVFRQRVFDFIKDGEELVEVPFRRMIAAQQLLAHPYDGFWACMDTFKEKQHLDEVFAQGHAPWRVWEKD
jgi:glucose-1-phosphate cytidylyltransferase